MQRGRACRVRHGRTIGRVAAGNPKRKVAYWSKRRELAHAEFNKLHKALNDLAAMAQRYSNLPTPGKESLDELRKLQREVRHCQKELQGVVDEQERIGSRAREAELEAAQNCAAASDFLSDLAKIRT